MAEPVVIESTEYMVSCAFCFGIYGRGKTRDEAIHDAKADGVQVVGITLHTGSLDINVCKICAAKTIQNHIDWLNR